MRPAALTLHSRRWPLQAARASAFNPGYGASDSLHVVKTRPAALTTSIPAGVTWSCGTMSPGGDFTHSRRVHGMVVFAPCRCVSRRPAASFLGGEG
jgi:hypothetical protein